LEGEVRQNKELLEARDKELAHTVANVKQLEKDAEVLRARLAELHAADVRAEDYPNC